VSPVCSTGATGHLGRALTTLLVTLAQMTRALARAVEHSPATSPRIVEVPEIRRS
jgi:uncharacterized protein YbjT (DUF2867 family)